MKNFLKCSIDMTGEVEKTPGAAGLAKHKPATGRAVDVRRELAAQPRTMEQLPPLDRNIFMASTRKPIADYTEAELHRKLATVAKYVIRDVGIRKIDDYDLKRFVDTVRAYYSTFTTEEVYNSFELLLAGELDEYLPTDKDGRPDKNHYQSFNVAYITKVLNAYKERRGETIHKAYLLSPRQAPAELSDGNKTDYKREWAKIVINSYLAYKYKGLAPEGVYIGRIYEELAKLGLAGQVEITDEDKKTAVARLLKASQSGMVKDFIAECIRHQRANHHDVISEAGFIAKEKALIKSFASMVEEEMQITDYIRL